MTKSDNTKGNQWHDEEGKFTSPDAATLGVSVDDFLSYKNGSNIQLKGLDLLNSIIDEVVQVKGLDDLNSILDDFLSQNVGIQLDFSLREDDVKENLFKALSNKKYIGDLVSHIDFYGTNKYNRINHLYYRLDRYYEGYSNPVVYDLAYARFPKKAKVISKNEYDSKMAIIKQQGSGQLNGGYNYNRSYMLSDEMYDNIENPEKRDLGCGMISVFRGLGINSSSAAREAKAMYASDSEANPIMGSSYQNSGSVHYFSMQQQYANDYSSGSYDVIKGIVNLTGDKATANIIKKEQLSHLNYSFKRMLSRDTSFQESIKDSLRKSLTDGGYDDIDNKTQVLFKCITDAIEDDWGFVALLCGAQALVAEPGNGSQFDLYDLSLLEMVED